MDCPTRMLVRHGARRTPSARSAAVATGIQRGEYTRLRAMYTCSHPYSPIDLSNGEAKIPHRTILRVQRKTTHSFARGGILLIGVRG
jgi:hypothetical protein